jgi:hypothetical protein
MAETARSGSWKTPALVGVLAVISAAALIGYAGVSAHARALRRPERLLERLRLAGGL